MSRAEAAERVAAPPSDPTGRPWETKAAGGFAPGPGITAHALAAKLYDPPRFLVAGLIPEGLTVLGGAPKQGKSWLSLLIAWAVAAGEPLDGRPSRPGDVLYLALEDTERRLQSRLLKLAPGLCWPFPETLTMNVRWPRADENGLYHVWEWLEARKGTARMVIVDTLARFRKPQKGTGNSYQDDYDALVPLKKCLDHYKVSGIVVHHTRKLKAEDPFEELSGTQAISGAADTILVLDRDRGSRTARLYATGRDLPDSTIPLDWNPEFCRWTLGETADGIDTDGRNVGGKPAGTKSEQAAAWLRVFLREFAHPSAEIMAAGTRAGFSPAAIKQAKTDLGREGSGELWNRKYGSGDAAEWWSGLGPPEKWVRRTVCQPATADRQEVRQLGCSEELPVPE